MKKQYDIKHLLIGLLLLLGVPITLGVIFGEENNTEPIKVGEQHVPDTSLEQEPSQKTETKTTSSKQESVSPPAPTFNRIEMLSSIRIGGGILWENWDSDSEKDGPVIEIVYLDSQGDIISSDATRKMPISADVKAYAKNKGEMKPSSSASKLVFSAHYTKDQIILGGIYPKIRIPKEQIKVDPLVDSNEGAIEVIIHTPEQGDFGDKQGWFVLYPY